MLCSMSRMPVFEALAAGVRESAGTKGLMMANQDVCRLAVHASVVRAGIRLSLEQNSIAFETAGFYRQWMESLEVTFTEFQAGGELRAEITPRAAARAAVPVFTGAHLMSEVVDDWAHLYQDLLGIWRIWIPGTVVTVKQSTLLEEAERMFAGPQPRLVRGHRPAVVRSAQETDI